MASQSHSAPVVTRSLPAVAGTASVTTADPACRLIFRGRDQAVQAASAAYGVALPTVPCRANRDGTRAALWLGPDEWLLLAPMAEAASIAAALAQALAGAPHALVDISDRNCGLELEGPRVEDVLASGCPLDLDAKAFPVGMCTRTLFAKAEIVLWRTAAHAFHLEVVRSFQPYLEGLLARTIRDTAALAAL